MAIFLMNRTKALLEQNIWIIGILLGLISWFFDGLIDFLFFSQATLIESLFFPEPVEIWMRSFNFFILLVFGWIVHFGWNRQNKIQEDLELSQKQGKQLLHQFRSILEGTSQHTGEHFFSSMVKQLAETLNVRYAFIGTLDERHSKMQSLSFFSDGKFSEKIAYDLTGTPCESVLNKVQCVFTENVQKDFPEDHYLKENNIESYIGYALKDIDDSPIGIMSVMDTKPFDERENIQSILKAFAARVEAELRRIQIEKKLEHYAKKLEQSNQDLQEFAYIASHDLKEPLRKIMVFGEMFEKKVMPLDEEQKHLLTRITNGASRMNDLIDDLLQLSRIKTQSTTLVKWDLNKIVNKTLEELEATISETQAKIHIEKLPTLRVDKVHIHQLFQNLIGNSLKYKNPDLPPEINIFALKNKQEIWEISVTDNGIGFDEKYADKIFKPFERLHNRETYKGTGMGLAICKKIVERHNGTITAKGSEGKGTHFTFTLPDG
jgi:signal transduction histidine kinase